MHSSLHKIKVNISAFLFFNLLLGFSTCYAEGGWRCFGAGVAELFVPGLGYVMTSQYDKSLLLGGGRWIASNKMAEAEDSEGYQEDSDDIYVTIDADESESEKEETYVYMNRETWTYRYNASLYSNLLLTTWGDMYQHGCKPNTETYQWMAAPLNFAHFYDNWMFWLPTLFLVGNYHTIDKYVKVEYYLGRGLTQSQVRRDSLSQYYMVGVGEEMFFRGAVQHSIYDALKDRLEFSPALSRHMSIFLASAVFAAAHNGAGFTANSGSAFLFGLYEGYVYHPSIDEFDLTTAIAVHAWWDILVTYAILNHAEFFEKEEDVSNDQKEKKRTSPSIPLASIAFRF